MAKALPKVIRGGIEEQLDMSQLAGLLMQAHRQSRAKQNPGSDVHALHVSSICSLQALGAQSQSCSDHHKVSQDRPHCIAGDAADEILGLDLPGR